MCQVAIDIPEAVLYDTRMSREEACQFAKRAVALGYYSQSGVSIGYCAQIAEMTEIIFLFSGLMMRKNFWRNWKMRRVIIEQMILKQAGEK